VTQIALAATLLGTKGIDLEFEKVGGICWVCDDDSEKPIYILNITFGTPRVSVSRRMTPDSISTIPTEVGQLNSESVAARAYNLLSTSLDRGTDELQGFIAAWSALEIFINSAFKSTYEARWFTIMMAGTPESSKPIFDRLEPLHCR